MRAFLCSFGNFHLAIPMHSVLSLALHEKNSERIEKNSYISLLELFNLPEESIKHNIILKNENAADDGLAENKIILFIPKVECETEIPGEKIYPIPKALGRTRFSAFFNGIQFSSGLPISGAAEIPVLILNSEHLLAQRRIKHDKDIDS